MRVRKCVHQISWQLIQYVKIFQSEPKLSTCRWSCTKRWKIYHPGTFDISTHVYGNMLGHLTKTKSPSFREEWVNEVNKGKKCVCTFTLTSTSIGTVKTTQLCKHGLFPCHCLSSSPIYLHRCNRMSKLVFSPAV